MLETGRLIEEVTNLTVHKYLGELSAANSRWALRLKI